MGLLARCKYWAQQRCPNFILQPLMRWRIRRLHPPTLIPAPQEAFGQIFKSRSWGSDSASGPGSVMDATVAVRDYLPQLINRLAIRTFLDVPCGDFYWMQHVAIPPECHYTGGDIVPALIAHNQAKFASAKRSFMVLDLVKDPIPTSDLILVRDCFIHLPFEMIKAALANIRKSGSKYLLTTNYVDKRRHWDGALGGFRSINLRLAPFNLPAPLETMPEHPGLTVAQGKFNDRSLCLWPVKDLPL